MTNENYYRGWEDYYRNSNRGTAWSEESEPAVKDLIDIVGICEAIRVADLGCGDGRNTVPWLRAGAHVVCVDIAPTALHHLDEQCERHSIPRPTLLCRDISCTDLASGQFDVVQCYDALPQVRTPRAVIEEMFRILKPGGVVGFNVFTVGDCAYGEGEEVERHTFLYKKTLFRFFEDGDIDELLPADIELLSKETRSWMDPPHEPFRPMPHRHEAIFFSCRRH